MTPAQKRLARKLGADGMSLPAIAKLLGRSDTGIGLVVTGIVRGANRGLDEWQPAAGRLQPRERDAIVVGIARGDSLRTIARELGRAASTVSREVQANGGREEYHAFAAHRRARTCVRRPKPAKLVAGPLCDQVTQWLIELWSPREIAGRLRRDFKGDPMMQVCHETIYQSLYVQGRGELRRELARCLRRGHTQRKPQGQVQRAGKIPDMVMISERPAEVEDRAVPGHCEFAKVEETGSGITIAPAGITKYRGYDSYPFEAGMSVSAYRSGRFSVAWPDGLEVDVFAKNLAAPPIVRRSKRSTNRFEAR